MGSDWLFEPRFTERVDLTTVVIVGVEDRMDQNRELCVEFMDDDEVQEVLTEPLRRQVYQESQQAEG